MLCVIFDNKLVSRAQVDNCAHMRRTTVLILLLGAFL